MISINNNDEQDKYTPEVPVNPLRESLPKQFIEKLNPEPLGNQNPIEENRNFQQYLKKREEKFYEATTKEPKNLHQIKKQSTDKSSRVNKKETVEES